MRIFATSKPVPSAAIEELMKDMDEEIAKGRELYEQGVIIEAYMDTEYSRTFMIVEAENIEAAKRRFDEYPQVKSGLITFDFVQLVGMPAIAEVHQNRGDALPKWWPATAQ